MITNYYKIYFQILIIIYFILNTGCSGCTYFYLDVKDLNSKNESNNGSDFIEAPTSLILKNYNLMPISDPRPIYTVSGVTTSTNLKLVLFSDSTCTQFLGEYEASEATIDLILLNDLDNGTYQMSVQLVDKNKPSRKSNCKISDSILEIDKTTPSISAITPSAFISNVSSNVTINGSHFTYDMIVYVDDALCENLVILSTTSLTCEIPPFSNGTHSVTLSKFPSLMATATQDIMIDPELPKAPICTDGNIYSFTSSDDLVFYGGIFSKIGTCVGGGLPINIKTGVIKNYPSGNFPEVDGSVFTSEPDGNGGLFIGGEFWSVGGVLRNNFAHILSDGSVDPVIGSKTNFDGQINKILYDQETQRLFVAGAFTGAGRSIESSGAFFDKTNFKLKGNSKLISGVIMASISDGSGGFYIGGFLNFVDSIPVGNLVHMIPDANGDMILDTVFNMTSNGPVYSLALDGSWLYVGGEFTEVQGAAQNYLAKINKLTGARSPTFNANIPENMGIKINSLLIHNNQLFLGGQFSQVSGQARTNLAAISISTESLDTNFVPNPDGAVYQMVTTGTYLYVAGTFNNIGGQAIKYLAALNLTNGAANASFNPNPSRALIDQNIIRSIALSANNSTLYAGGAFTSIGGASRHLVAEVDVTTGSATNFNLSIAEGGSSQNMMAIFRDDNILYIAGNYYMPVLNKMTAGISAIDLNSMTVTDFKPKLTGWYSYSYTFSIKRIAISTNNSLVFFGGSYESIYDESRFSIAEINTVTGELTNFKPEISKLNLPTSPEINDLYIKNSKLYIGGDFKFINGETRIAMAAFDLSTGSLNSVFNPNFANSTGTPIINTMVEANSKLYLGGIFNKIENKNRSNLGVINLDTGVLTDGLNIGTNGTVNILKQHNQNVFIGGSFTQIEGITSNNFAHLSLENNVVAANTSLNSISEVFAFNIKDNNLYIGSATGVSALNLTSGSMTNFNPQTSGAVKSISSLEEKIFVGGDFSFIRGQSRNSLAAINRVTGDADDFNPKVTLPSYFGSGIHSQAVIGDTLYIGGDFISVGTLSRLGLAAINISTAEVVSEFQADTNGSVYTITTDGIRLFVGGKFDDIGGVSRNLLAAIYPTTGSVDPYFNGHLGGTVGSRYVQDLKLSPDNSKLFVAGRIYISSFPNDNLISLNATTGSYNATFNFDFNYPTTSLNIINDILYVGGWFENINFSNTRVKLSSIDLTTELLTNFNENSSTDPLLTGPNEDIYTLTSKDSSLFVLGQFTAINGQKRDMIASYNVTTGKLTSFNPSFKTRYSLTNNYRSQSLYILDNKLFIGGYMLNHFDHRPRSHGVLDLTTEKGLSNW